MKNLCKSAEEPTDDKLDKAWTEVNTIFDEFPKNKFMKYQYYDEGME